jgi:SAM-dependent MidA family methyltransferase
MYGPNSQRNFLTCIGIEIWAAALAHVADSQEREQAIEGGADRLVDPLRMSRQYKVLGVVAKGVEEEGQDLGKV